MGINFQEKYIPQIKEMIEASAKSVKRKLNPNRRNYWFEIFGYDFIIDDDHDIWLIEVNTNPCLEESSPLLQQLIPRMIDDAFSLTLDRIFKPENNRSPSPRFG